jgi:hypothetical protein
VVDYLWALLGLGAVLIAVDVPIAAFLLFASRQRPDLHAARNLRRRSLLDLTLGVLGLAYVAILLINGGFIFLIGAIAGLSLVVISLLGLRLAATRPETH